MHGVRDAAQGRRNGPGASSDGLHLASARTEIIPFANDQRISCQARGLRLWSSDRRNCHKSVDWNRDAGHRFGSDLFWSPEQQWRSPTFPAFQFGAGPLSADHPRLGRSWRGCSNQFNLEVRRIKNLI